MTTSSVHWQGPAIPAAGALLDAGARRFLARLLVELGPRVPGLLAAREHRRQRVAAGDWPAFDRTSRPATRPGWHGLESRLDRRVELHVAPRAEHIDAALATDSDVVVVSLETALPCAGGALDGLLAVRDSAGNGTPLLLVPRALDRLEYGLTLDDEPVPAALVDAGLHLYHARGTAYVGLSQIESAEEAAFWRDVIRHAATHGVAGPVEVTVAIDSVFGAFAARDLLYELRDVASALGAGRHAYLRSVVRTFGHQPQFVLPDREELTMSRHFLRSRGLLQIRTAHQRNIAAIGPESLRVTTGDTDADGLRMTRFRHTAAQAVRDGYDGIGVRDPALVPVAREMFDRLLPAGHQRHRTREDIHIEGADLTQIATGKITERGLRRNLRIALAGLRHAAEGDAEFMLEGSIEHGASVELAAAQLWQWVHLETGILDEGRIIDADLFDALLAEESASYGDTHISGDAPGTRTGDAGTAAARAAERLRAFVLAGDLTDRLL